VTRARLIVIFVAAGCARPAAGPAVAPVADAGAVEPDAMSSSNSVTFNPHQIPALGLTLPVVAGFPVSAGAAGGISYAMQTTPDVALGAWWGPGRDLAAWRGFYQPSRTATFARETAVTVCGQPARRQEAALGEVEPPTGFAVGADGQNEPIIGTGSPAEVAVAVALRVGDQAVLVEWRVRADRRAAHRAAEERFFAELRCP
jgi:hypothetical protein